MAKGMTAKNVMAGFKTTGIYPFNPAALIPDPPAATSSLCERTAIKYIPFHSRRCSHFRSLLDEPQPNSRSEVESDPQRADISNDNNSDCHSALIEFTHEEVCFQKRLDEHYDFPGDEGYQQWLKQRHESFRHSTPLTDDDSLPFNLQRTFDSYNKRRKRKKTKAKEQRKLERALKNKEKEELLANKSPSTKRGTRSGTVADKSQSTSAKRGIRSVTVTDNSQGISAKLGTRSGTVSDNSQGTCTSAKRGTRSVSVTDNSRGTCTSAKQGTKSATVADNCQSTCVKQGTRSVKLGRIVLQSLMHA
uniref:Uncharacterized protein n=1 Tax=Amphimedon queenslandica TaxID=400682 RepID=A0A1X7VTX9_AMPQE